MLELIVFQDEVMSEIKLALNCEINAQYIQAVYHYEDILDANNKPSIDVYINLAFLYWKFATQLPFIKDSETVSDELGLFGAVRFQVILEKGLAEYPKSVELRFWNRYFPYRGLFDEFTREDCEQIIQKYGDTESIVPYFFLYLFDKIKYKEKRDQLYLQCEQLLTAKNHYIKSIIE